MTDKDITYYQQVAENYYLSHFAEIKEETDKKNAENEELCKDVYKAMGREYDFEEQYHEYVNVNTQNESCFFSKHGIQAVRPMELMFSCRMNDGKAKTHLVKDGKDKIAEMLGLVDLYDNIERIEVDYVRKKDRFLHLDLPECLQAYSKDFFKVKLYGLDDFVSDCNYTGWGDCWTNNVLEVIAGLLKQDCIDFEKKEIEPCLNWIVGPSDSEGMDYYAQFEFSHCELAKDDDNDAGWAVFICYFYSGMQEYDE